MAQSLLHSTGEDLATCSSVLVYTNTHDVSHLLCINVLNGFLDWGAHAGKEG